MSLKPNSVTRIPSLVRKSDVWRRLAAVLDEHGVRFSIGHASRHWFVEFAVGETTRRHTFSAAPSDYRTVQNSAAALRRRLRAEREGV